MFGRIMLLCFSSGFRGGLMLVYAFTFGLLLVGWFSGLGIVLCLVG